MAAVACLLWEIERAHGAAAANDAGEAAEAPADEAPSKRGLARWCASSCR